MIKKTRNYIEYKHHFISISKQKFLTTDRIETIQEIKRLLLYKLLLADYKKYKIDD
jgi:hypothetical protein